MPPRLPLLMLFVGGAVAFQKPGGAFQATPPPRAASHLRAATDVDVSDLKVAMDELDKPLEELTVDTRGVEHTSRTGIEDDGCAWTESNERVDVVLRIPGLRGQPSMSLAVDVTPTTCTVSSFGVTVWSCLLRGRADPASVAFDVSDGADAVPTIELRCGKADGARWNGFIESVGEDSIL